MDPSPHLPSERSGKPRLDLPRTSPRQRRGGVALIAILGTLSAVTVMLTALLASAKSELQSSLNFQSTLNARDVSETAVNLVIGQIRRATATGGTSWASQPGALRTWDQDGGFAKAFKLYSDSQMETTDEAALSADAPPFDWNARPDHYIDLNEPAIRDSGLDFPIIDPRVMNGTASGDPGVEGFSYTEGVGGVVADGDEDALRLPMPVQWIYMLQDGTLGHLDETSGEFISATGKVATSDNPMVARIAFWADDETSKVNINTASEPTFWDLPRAVCAEDISYGQFQPVQNEFQRYSGHPATVALSPIISGDLDFDSMSDADEITYKESVYAIVPRITGGGSRGASTRVDPNNYSEVIITDSDRLFASADEMVVDTSREAATSARDLFHISPDRMSRRSFFLTSNSRAPEVNMLGFPRIAIWPVSAEEMEDNPRFENRFHRTAKDGMFAFCSTVNGHPYIFQRMDADSATRDFDEVKRNRDLYSYLQRLTSERVPGYGASFESKLGADRDQVITEMLDYIRLTAAYDVSHPRETYGNGEEEFVTQFTNSAANTGGSTREAHGQVVPLRRGDTQGFGRFFTISEFGVLFLCGADGGDGEDGGKAVPKGDGMEGADFGNMQNYGKHPDLNDSDTLNDVWYSNIPPNPKDTDFETDKWLGDDIPDGAPHPAFDNRANWNYNLEDGKPLERGQKRVQCVFYFETNCLGMGFPFIEEDMHVRVVGLDGFELDGQPLQMPADRTITLRRAIGHGWHMHPFGGSAGLRTTLPRSSLYSAFVTIDEGATMSFTGGSITVELSLDDPTRRARGETPVPLQTMTVNIPGGTFPVPELVETGTFPYRGCGRTEAPYWWRFGQASLRNGAVLHTDRNNFNSWHQNGNRQSQLTQPPTAPFYFVPEEHRFPRSTGNHPPGFKSGTVFRQEDVARSVVPKLGDIRQIAAREIVTEDLWEPHFGWNDSSVRHNHLIQSMFGIRYHGYSNQTPVNAADIIPENQMTEAHYQQGSMPDIPRGAGMYQRTGDFDNGVGPFRDGCYYNRPDEGQLRSQLSYFDNVWSYTSPRRTYFSPNRMVPSPGMFGSLPTGIKRKQPFETLLFRPWVRTERAEKQGYDHPGASNPPDHLLMDLFWMPVVEPYAISDPMSTAGKINMNSQILPFSYIRRETALRSLLKSEELIAIPNEKGIVYKNWDHSNSDWPWFPHQIPPNSPWFIPIDSWTKSVEFRQPVDADETLRQWDDKFTGSGDTSKATIFRSATEICEMHLVPEGTTLEDMKKTGKEGFWGRHVLTGENARERHYANLYARLTTKSNTFRVHYRVQMLKKSRSTAPNVFDGTRDSITGEHRGSTLIERFINPKDSDIPDFAASDIDPSENLMRHFRFRIVSNRIFGG